MTKSPAVDELAIGALEFIANGGQGKVSRAVDFRLPDCGSGLAFKRYFEPVSAAGLERIVALRDALIPAEKQELDGLAAWPVRLVRNGTSTVGILMPLIPEKYFQNRVLPGSGMQVHSTREFQYLFIPPERAENLGFPLVTTNQRLALCGAYAAALNFLHERSIVFGDISSKNGLWSLDGGSPSVMIVDCDAVRVTGHGATLEQLNSPDWLPPEGERQAMTIATDRYKFGLFVLRALKPGPNVSTRTDPSWVDGLLDGEGMRLLHASLDSDPSRRTPIAAWAKYFGSTKGQPVQGSGRSLKPPPGTVTEHSGWVRNADGTWRAADGSPGVPRPQPTASPGSHGGWVKGPDGGWVEKI